MITNVNPVQTVKRVSEKLLLGMITEQQICNLVAKMKSKFSTGIDGISNDLLKN